MTLYEFIITYQLGLSPTVYAFNRDQALILGQAERIKAGLTYRNYTSIIQVTN